MSFVGCLSSFVACLFACLFVVLVSREKSCGFVALLWLLEFFSPTAHFCTCLAKSLLQLTRNAQNSQNLHKLRKQKQKRKQNKFQFRELAILASFRRATFAAATARVATVSLPTISAICCKSRRNSKFCLKSALFALSQFARLCFD